MNIYIYILQIEKELVVAAEVLLEVDCRIDHHNIHEVQTTSESSHRGLSVER